MAKKNQQPAPSREITKEDLVPYVISQGEALKKKVAEYRLKYGNRYNMKNSIEELYRRFGRPEEKPIEFVDEYVLILQKKSQLPAVIRPVIADIGNAAYANCYFDRRNAIKAYEAKHAPKTPKKTTKKTKKEEKYEQK